MEESRRKVGWVLDILIGGEKSGGDGLAKRSEERSGKGGKRGRERKSLEMLGGGGVGVYGGERKEKSWSGG